jgi:ankyrin repeat protein
MSALMNAVNKNNVSLVKQLIADGANVNELDSNQDAPLVMAAYKGFNEIVKLLLEAGADVRAVDPGMKATALHAAAYAGRTEAARLLIEHHIDINKQGPYNGYTALHDAIWQDNIDIVKLLLAANADLTLLSNDEKSPLDFARSKNRKEIIALILAKTAG